MATRESVDVRLSVEVGKQSQLDAAFVAEVTDFLCRWAEKDVKSGRKTKAKANATAKRTPVASLRQRLGEYFLNVHSGFAVDSDKLVNYVSVTAMTVERRAKLVDAVCIASTDLNWSRKYPGPSCSKWTKGGPCMARQVTASISGELRHVSKVALGPLEFQLVEDSKWGEMDHMVERNAKNGKCKEAFETQVNDTNRTIGIAIAAVCQEADQLLSLTYCSYAHGCNASGSGEEPNITLLTNDKSSVIYAALRYLRVLGSAKRLGSSSFQIRSLHRN